MTPMAHLRRGKWCGRPGLKPRWRGARRLRVRSDTFRVMVPLKTDAATAPTSAAMTARNVHQDANCMVC